MMKTSRYTISSNEEVWVRICYQFFEKNGFWDWYEIPKDQAFKEMAIFSKGQINFAYLKEKIDELYLAAGVKQHET